MIINIRYHIVSIVAVFLALGIGILVGSMIIGSGTLSNQQQQLAERLEKHLTELRQENALTRERLSSLEMETQLQKQFTKDILPFLINGRLEGRKVAIVETSPFPPTGDLKPVLEMAGAKVTSVTTITNGLAVAERKGELLSITKWQDTSDTKLVRQTASALAQAVLEGKTPLVEYLAQEELINVIGEYGVPVDSVVMVGGGYDKDRDIITDVDITMINYFVDHRIAVYGAEESTVTNSYMKEYQRRCKATVDNIDMVAGQFALVMAISGKPGDYGVKETADRLIPPFHE
ncbi:MAG: copper transporter [Bacillota bacterium]|uniref:copper transporter n=1 Tax=Desulforudis sp. DRI-14 TaxID=3459793 RepID=UPI00348F1D6E